MSRIVFTSIVMGSLSVLSELSAQQAVSPSSTAPSQSSPASPAVTITASPSAAVVPLTTSASDPNILWADQQTFVEEAGAKVRASEVRNASRVRVVEGVYAGSSALLYYGNKAYKGLWVRPVSGPCLVAIAPAVTVDPVPVNTPVKAAYSYANQSSTSVVGIGMAYRRGSPEPEKCRVLQTTIRVGMIIAKPATPSANQSQATAVATPAPNPPVQAQPSSAPSSSVAGVISATPPA